MTANTLDRLRDRDAERTRSEGDMIPRGLLIAMAALALSSLAIVSFAVLTDRAHVGRPVDAAIVQERLLYLDGHGAKAVTVRDADGKVVMDLAHGGFITVIENGLERARTVKRVAGDRPVRLVAFANGRLAIIDPETGWSAELGAFGSDNKAAFERLLDD